MYKALKKAGCIFLNKSSDQTKNEFKEQRANTSQMETVYFKINLSYIQPSRVG